MNGVDTMAMSYHDYQAAIHLWEKANAGDDEGEDAPSIDEVEAMFDSAAARGIGRVH
jgi:hypothetical protein